MSTQPDPTPTPPDPTPAPDAPPAFASITSQEEFDRRIQERIARVKKELPPDYEELQSAKKELDEIKAASQSELERLQAQLTESEQRAERARQTAERQLVSAAILMESSKQNAIRPEHMHRLIDTGEITVSNDGSVVGVEDAVKAFLEENPEYVGKQAASGGSADQGARGGGGSQLTRDDLKKMSSAEIVKAQDEGRLDHLTGASTST